MVFDKVSPPAASRAFIPNVWDAVAEEQATGKGKRGRKLKPADDTVHPDAVANVTDPDSEIMKTRRGWAQGYNGQAMVTADQIIVAAERPPRPMQQLQPMLPALASLSAPRLASLSAPRKPGHGITEQRPLPSLIVDAVLTDIPVRCAGMLFEISGYPRGSFTRKASPPPAQVDRGTAGMSLPTNHGSRLGFQFVSIHQAPERTYKAAGKGVRARAGDTPVIPGF